jgi:cytoskeleton-associated protein 5
VKEGTLDNLITELLLWLLDERVPLMDDGSQLLKALNVLMLKILVRKISSSPFPSLIICALFNGSVFNRIMPSEHPPLLF